jgi:hypothetical protein
VYFHLPEVESVCKRIGDWHHSGFKRYLITFGRNIPTRRTYRDECSGESQVPSHNEFGGRILFAAG